MMESVKNWCCWRLAICVILFFHQGFPIFIWVFLLCLLPKLHVISTGCIIHDSDHGRVSFFFKFRVAFSSIKGTQLQNAYLWYKVEFSWRNDNMNIFLISASMKGNKSIYTISFTLPPCSTAFINYFIPSTEIQLDSDNSRMSWVNYWFLTFNISRSSRKQSVVTVFGIIALPLW